MSGKQVALSEGVVRSWKTFYSRGDSAPAISCQAGTLGDTLKASIASINKRGSCQSAFLPDSSPGSFKALLLGLYQLVGY